MQEVLREHRDKIDSSDAVTKLGLEPGKYIIVSAHREVNIGSEKNFLSLMSYRSEVKCACCPVSS
jgi:UDP-N-acetylglucosamine 2-epimerase